MEPILLAFLNAQMIYMKIMLLIGIIVKMKQLNTKILKMMQLKIFLQKQFG